MVYVITDGDEGIQINEGTRLGVLGVGLKMPGFKQVVKLLQKLLDKQIRVVANAENSWIKEKFELDTWEQADAAMQQQVAALAKKHKLLYAGMIPFADPKQLKHEIKGHMVRPKGIHIANKICFSLGGGEQTYHLGHYQIAAEWVAAADKKLVKDFITTQVKFYQQQASTELAFEFETGGKLGEAVAQANRKVIESLGFKAE